MEKILKKYSWPYGVLLTLIVVIGLAFQLNNISYYNVYPDSYQSITVAQNLKEYHSLTAPMGENGTVYPDFFGWTRPFYPFLIVLASFFGFSLFDAGHIVAIAAGTLAIIAIYALVNCVLESKKAGLIAALLMATSYSHALWGGYIFTESLGVLMLTLGLWSLWRHRDKKDNWFINEDIFTGLIFAAAIFTRYEYIVLLVSAAFLAGSKFSPKRALSILLTMTATIVLVLALLHPFTGDWNWIWSQLKDFVIILGVSILAIGAGTLLLKRQKTKIPIIEKWTARTALLALAVGLIVLISRHSAYLGLWDFISDDPLLCISALLGLILLILKEKKLGLILFAGIAILAAAYYQVNPTMERYLTHLTPLLLIAGGYGIFRFTQLKFKPAVITLLIIFFSLQSFKSWNGLHNANNGIWYKPSYEELSAKILKTKVGKSDLLIASMPEPYYLFTGAPTQSVSDTPPFIYSYMPDTAKVTIVEDEGMRTIFPEFTKFAHQNLSQYKSYQYSVGELLRYKTSFIEEKNPVMIYKINAQKLRNLLDIPEQSR